MKRRYHIVPERKEPTDSEIAGYKNAKKLIYDYENAVRRPKKPIYRDPKSFIFLLLVVLLAYLISESGGKKEDDPSSSDPTEQATGD